MPAREHDLTNHVENGQRLDTTFSYPKLLRYWDQQWPKRRNQQYLLKNGIDILRIAIYKILKKQWDWLDYFSFYAWFMESSWQS